MPSLILLAVLVNVGSRLELFVDDYLIETMRGVHLKLHEPRRMGKILAFDQPWEGNTSAYVTVFQDGDRYRMYYRGRADPKYVPRKTGAGGLQAHPEFQVEADGEPLGPPLVGDLIEHELPLGKRQATSAIRLRFVMRDADVYSIRFRD